MHSLAGKTAVVTGAGRGLGAALAISLAEAGCKLILCGRNLAQLADTASIIQNMGGANPVCIATDLADVQSVQDAVDTITTSHTHIDLLINNGAMWLQASDEAYTPAQVLGVINSAVTGTFLFTQGLLPLLRLSEGADILTIGSISGLPNARMQSVSVPFYAAKRAQSGLADGFRQMLAGTPIRSISVHPPYLDDVAPQQPEWDAVQDRKKGERASSKDVVDAVLFALTRPRHITLSVILDADEGGVFG
ncbi:SDR family oxidoreductase [Undibacterium pigrum]|uniref:NADP-dependent 3-hydroxy acid dehydrogenase YdfG n=1 Tax=Undibacterium pigrum TaxID=401470 RepID=A0A318II96_9BURK|nr:SDR family oxidoreductase [Undibacterium pigrum]PXX33729.1 NADP-dependent 3-hydroxy acid dehydrogenase YdfG [Undibacterium pigrum]